MNIERNVWHNKIQRKLSKSICVYRKMVIFFMICLHRQLRRERQSTDEFKKKRNEKDREKYRTDENFRNRIKAKSYEYNRMRVENGLPLHTTKLDDNALLEWLDLHPNVGLLHAGVSFEEYVKSLTLNDLQKEFPEFVSDTFLKKKDYCVYINTFFDWEQVKGKTLGEIEKIVRAAEDDKTKKMGIYVGKYGGGQKSRPGHKYEGACFEFLEENEGSVGFTTFIINCNVGCIKTASGEKLRQLVTDSEAFASKLEAFIIVSSFTCF
ncbi:uncharacterized protein LOC118435131 isoform X1 [Folsomia candida]|uniref:uncharacterized protein LOC118435131 isoform X1 n=1 Tax=Folsomia candida TaxID=158441 RepID=UPI001604DD3E|nr:uncharacterized protein LOC118435131 isoform X1 [Folsomia candida]